MGKKERHTQTKQATTTTRTTKGLKSSTAGAMREGRQAKNQNVGAGKGSRLVEPLPTGLAECPGGVPGRASGRVPPTNWQPRRRAGLLTARMAGVAWHGIHGWHGMVARWWGWATMMGPVGSSRWAPAGREICRCRNSGSPGRLCGTCLAARTLVPGTTVRAV